MRTHLLAIASLLALSPPLLAADAPIGKGGLEGRPAKQLLRATKIGYQRLAAAQQAHEAMSSRLHGYGGLLYGDRSGVPFMDGTLRAYASWSDAEAAIAGQKDPVAARRNVAYVVDKMKKIDQLLGELPAEATRGFRFGSLFGNPLLRGGDGRGGSLYLKMAEIADRTTAITAKRVSDVAERVREVEDHLVGQMDERYLKGHEALKTRIAAMPPETLYDHALALVQQIDALAHGKEIARETVEKGQSSSNWSSGSSSESRSASFGALGNLKSASRSDSSSYASGSSKSSYSRDQLILHAASYQVSVRTTSGGGWTVEKSLTPVEARALTGLLLDLHDVTRALEKKDGAKAAPLSAWLEHSSIRFVANAGKDYQGKAHFNEREVQFGHAPRDVIGLQKIGLLSERMARRLDKDLRAPLVEGLETGGSLWQ
jgi:hypothetical protein